jgi:hypothetical protein
MAVDLSQQQLLNLVLQRILQQVLPTGLLFPFNILCSLLHYLEKPG